MARVVQGRGITMVGGVRGYSGWGPTGELARDELGAGVCMRTGWVVLQMAEGHILC